MISIPPPPNPPPLDASRTHRAPEFARQTLTQGCPEIRKSLHLLDHLNQCHYLEVKVPVPDGLEDGEDLLPGAAHQEKVLGLVEGDDPGVPLHRRRALLVLQRNALLAKQVEALHFHLENQ